MQFIKRNRYLLLAIVIFIITIVAMVNEMFAEILFVAYIVLAVYFVVTSDWRVTYVKGRKPPIEIIASRRK